MDHCYIELDLILKGPENKSCFLDTNQLCIEPNTVPYVNALP